LLRGSPTPSWAIADCGLRRRRALALSGGDWSGYCVQIDDLAGGASALPWKSSSDTLPTAPVISGTTLERFIFLLGGSNGEPLCGA
jgi:hypothetical protein